MTKMRFVRPVLLFLSLFFMISSTIVSSSFGYMTSSSVLAAPSMAWLSTDRW